MIDALASEPHYATHLIPIWNALEARGTFWACGRALDRLDSARLDPRPGRRPTTSARPVMVAAYRDLWGLDGRGHVLVEHGAGQTYSRPNSSYAGGQDRDKVGLFICPSARVADLNQRRYPGALTVSAGVPALDPWHSGERVPRPSAIAVSFHWNATVAPEARSAWNHFRGAMRLLAQAFGDVIGHAHPRAFRTLAPLYERFGIEPVEDFDEVLDRAAVYVCDNSSTIYEFASTGRPVVVMNAPWYRRDVEHGLRFWEFADVGLQVDEPDDLVAVVAAALEDPPAVAARRAEVVQQVYVATDGKAAVRAAQAIEALERS